MSTTAAPVTTVAPRTATSTIVIPRTRTASIVPEDPPIAVPSTFYISAQAMADLASPNSERQIELQLINAAWNQSWCATEPTVQFRANNSLGFQDPQECGLLQNANLAIGLDSIRCTDTRLLLTFRPFMFFALLNNESENIQYEFSGNYLLIPPEARAQGVEAKLDPLPLIIIADQTGNVTCDPNATAAPPPTNATTLAPIFRIPWPSEVDVFLWNVVAGVGAAASIAAGSTAGAAHVVWMHRMALLCSHNCNWQNVTETDIPLQNNPSQMAFDSLLESYYSDYESYKFIPFLSGMIFNLIVCAFCSALHALISVTLGLTSGGSDPGMADGGGEGGGGSSGGGGIKTGMSKAHFPAAWTFPIWAWFYVPTVTAAITIFAKSSEAEELDAIVPGAAAVIVIIFIAVLAAHAVVVVGQLRARSIKTDPKAEKTHWLTTPIQKWGDRLGFEGYVNRFGAIFWMFSNTRHWFFFAEIGLMTVQAGLAGYRSLHPDCQTSTFTPLAITGVLGLFASLVLDPFLVFTDRIASYAFNVILVAGSIVAAFAGEGDEPLRVWATRVDQMGLAAMSLAAVYALGMAAVVAGRWGRGIKHTADATTEAEERKLASGKSRRVGAEGEPKELLRDLSPEEEEEMRRLAEEEARLAAAPALDPSVLAEPDPELREVLMRGNWVRMETEEGPYYYNRHTGKSVWDLRDEIGLPPLYRKRFQVADLSDDDEDDEALANPLGRRLVDRARSKSASPDRRPKHDPVADALAKREWIPIVDPGSGRTYYANTSSQETTWDLEERLGVKDAAQKQRELEEEQKKAAKDPLDEVLEKGDWVKVDSTEPGGGKPYFYHAASRKTVWNLRKELGLPDPKAETAKPPPPPPPIEDKTVVPPSDIERLANLMAPESPGDRVPSAIAAEAKIWWLPRSTDEASGLVSAEGGGLATPARNPLGATSAAADGSSAFAGGLSPIAGGGNNNTTAIASPALMRMLQEQAEVPTRRDDPVSLLLAHALATGEWVELPPAREGDPPTFINPTTKEVTADLRAVFEAQSNARRDPVQAALESKEWIEMMDPVTKKPFYVHVATKRPVWDLRAELEKESKKGGGGRDRQAKKTKKSPAASSPTAGRPLLLLPPSSASASSSSSRSSSEDSLDRLERRHRRKFDRDFDETASPSSRRHHHHRKKKDRTSGSHRHASSASPRHGSHRRSSSRKRRDSTSDSSLDGRRGAGVASMRTPTRPPPANDAPGQAGAAAGKSSSRRHGGREPVYGSKEYYQDLWDCL